MTDATLPSFWSRLSGRMRSLLRPSEDKPIDVLPVRVGGPQYDRPTPTPASVLGLDMVLVWVVIGLLACSLVMVYSASIAMPDNPRFGAISPMHFFVRHSMSISMGFVGALLAFQIPMKVWEKYARKLFVLSLVLLFAVLIYAADYMVRKMEVKERFFRAVLPMGAAVVLVGVLLLAEPDMGAFMVIVVISMGILFLGGVNARMFFLIALLVVLAFGFIIATSEWRRERIFAYLDPWDEKHALGKGYQLSHALIAIGRGEMFGVGLGRSVEKLHWLPEAHTDFLLSVIGEEFGLVGLLLIAATFFWMTRRIMLIGRRAIALDRVFSGLVAEGVAIWVGFQAFINMGVNLGALPTKGLTLPFMSYGGSAILLNLIAIAVVLRVDYENKLLMKGGRP